METKIFSQCCDKVAQKYYNKRYIHLSLAQIGLISYEIAELYNQSTAQERDELKKEMEHLKLSIRTQNKHYDYLKAENERLKKILNPPELISMLEEHLFVRVKYLLLKAKEEIEKSKGGSVETN